MHARSLAPPLALALALAACEPPPTAVTPRLTPDALGARAQRWTEFLREYLRIDTTVPPGNEARAVPLLRAALGELGLAAETATIAEGRANLWATLAAPRPDPGARPLILLHHIDVVPVEAGRWSVPAFEGAVKDGRLYGRGAIDTKVLAALHLAAMERLSRAADRLRRDVIFLAVADEEGGGTGAQHFVAHQLDRFRPEYLLDEGGFALKRFTNERDVVVIANTQKRAAKLRLVAKGEAGHGSRPIPNGGPSLLAEALARLGAQPMPLRVSPAARAPIVAIAGLRPFPESFLLARLDWPGFLAALSGKLGANKNLSPMLRDTIAVTVLRGGEKDNVIPSSASAVLDVRLLPDTRFEDFLAALRATFGDLPVEIEVLSAPGPELPVAPTADPLFEALDASVRAHAPDAAVSPWLLVGANDSRFFVPRGVRCYGFNPVFIDKAQLDGIHGHDENIALAELDRGMRIYVEALERFLLR